MNPLISKFQKRGIYFGTSSWKYTGWKGLVYQKSYKTEKEFEEKCLEEYAENFTCVGIDHTFYNWPTLKAMTKYNEQTPDGFKFGMKATEAVTILKYPKLPRYGKRAGTDNADFLKAEAFLEAFIPNIEPIKQKIGVIMFEFSHFYPGSIDSGQEFVNRLGTFLNTLRSETDLPFAVEIRNQSWLKEPYFKMLEENKVGHVYNSWTKMPPIGEQLSLSQKNTFPHYTSRLLLEPGTKYEEAVEAYSPYNKIMRPIPTMRKDTATLIVDAIEKGIPAYIFVNNRAEGCAPKTIDAILEEIPSRVKEIL